MSDSIRRNRRKAMRGGRGRKRRRNLGGHVVEDDTFVTGDAVFLWVVVKGREDEDMTGFNGIKEAVGGFVVITEAVIGKEDDVMTFGKKDYEDFLLFVGYKGRDHDGALTSVFDASVHVISEGFVIAIDGHFDPLAMDMNGRVTEMLEDVGIADSDAVQVEPTVVDQTVFAAQPDVIRAAHGDAVTEIVRLGVLHADRRVR